METNTYKLKKTERCINIENIRLNFLIINKFF